MEHSDYDRIKWETLDYIDDRCSFQSLWLALNAYAKSLAHPLRDEEKTEIAQRVLRDLLDAGLVFATYATNHDAYNLAFREFTPLPRELAERAIDLSSPERVGPLGDETVEGLWIFPTLDGQRAYWSLPADAFVTPRERHGRTEEDVARLEAEWRVD